MTDFPFRKLLVILGVALALPFAGFAMQGYIELPNRFYANLYHPSPVISLYISRILITFSLLSLWAGLIYPRISLWVGTARRSRVIAVYGSLLIFGIITHFQAVYLAKLVRQLEEDRVKSVYELMEPGDTAELLLQKIGQADENLTHRMTDSSRYKRIIGFPGNPDREYLLRIAFPGLRDRDVLMIEMSERGRVLKGYVQRLILLKRDKIVSIKPDLDMADYQTYRGLVQFKTDHLTFTPCGSEELFLLDLSEARYKVTEDYLRKLREKPDQNLKVVVSGAIEPSQDCTGCEHYNQSFKFVAFSSIRNVEGVDCDRN